MSLSSGDASDSICPKGWGIAGFGKNDDGSYHKLFVNLYGVSKNIISKTLTHKYKEYYIINVDELFFNSPFSFIYSGNYEHRGSAEGYSWGRRVFNNVYAHRLYYNQSTFDPQSANSRGYGYSVRCVAK